MLGGKLGKTFDNSGSPAMQALQDFEASVAGVKITDQGDALVTFLTDKGHIAVSMRRVVLERLFEQARNELQRVPRSGRT